MKIKLPFLFISLLSVFILSNCTTTSQMYLQSARNTTDTTYGFTMSNPILLVNTESYGNGKIIEQYISKLYMGIAESDSSRPYIRSFTIIKRETVDSIERYQIASEKREKIYTLYFKLVKHKAKLYIPFGFMYSRLAD